MDWGQLDRAEDWTLFPDNIGLHLSIDEKCVSQGKLYTAVTNKQANGNEF